MRVRSLVHATIGGVSRGSVALMLSLRIFFVKYLLSSWYCGLRCACARSCVAPASGLWFLGASLPLPGLWWRCRSGIARSCSPSRFPASVLVPGPWARLPRLSPSVRLLPLGRFDGWFFGFRLHFLGISRSVFGSV